MRVAFTAPNERSTVGAHDVVLELDMPVLPAAGDVIEAGGLVYDVERVDWFFEVADDDDDELTDVVVRLQLPGRQMEDRLLPRTLPS